MNLKLLTVLLCLCLTACVTPTVRDDSPANDLDALLSSAKRDLQPRLLPNGKEYCAEDAVLQQEQDACLGDLEDALFLANRSMTRATATLTAGAQRLKLVRNPCGPLERLFRSKRCKVLVEN